MILRATETAILELLKPAVDDIAGAGVIPFLLADEEEAKPQMPHIVIICEESEEIVTPGSGIFKVGCEVRLVSHTRASDAEWRQDVLDAINNFAYDTPAAKLSELTGFHCYGFEPKAGAISIDNDQKSTVYTMRYDLTCMARDNT